MAIAMRRGALVALLTLSCTRAPGGGQQTSAPTGTPPHPERPNLIMIVTDTVRADRVSAYGASRRTTPVFDRVAAQNFLFTNAYSPSSWTRPSVASLFTGTYPQTHGVQMRNDALRRDLPTLASLLRAEGMQTVAITTNPHVTATWKMTRGFERVIEIMPHPDKLKAGNGANVVYRRLREAVSSLREPFFLYVHLIDPHFPYEPPNGDLEALGLRAPQTDTHALYDGELHFADRHIGDMLDFLDAMNLIDNSVVVLGADHGEELGDHGSLGHGSTLYQEVVHVPLAIGIPSPLRGRTLGVAPDGKMVTCPRIETNVSLVDLLPTTLSLLDVDSPMGLDGVDLTPLMRCENESVDTRRPLFFSVEKEDHSLAGVLVEHSKLIVNRATGRRLLFLLDQNPNETLGLTPQGYSPQDVRELRQRLRSLLESFESSVQPGVHIELAGRDGQEDRQKLHLRLRTDGRITRVAARGFESTDRFVVNDEGSEMKIDVHLIARWHRSPLHIWAQDRDELHFELEPSDATLTVAVKKDGQWAAPAIVRFPEHGTSRWPVRLDRAHLEDVTARSLVDRRLPGVYVYAQRPAEEEKVEVLSQEIDAALRALGYVQ